MSSKLELWQQVYHAAIATGKLDYAAAAANVIKQELDKMEKGKTKPKGDKVTKQVVAEDPYKYVEFKHEGSQIVLPEGMTYERAITELERKMNEEETPVSIYEEVDAFPLDGAFALMKVLQHKYGWASPVPTPGFFGPTPPVMKNVEIDHGIHTQVFWGQFAMPGIDGRIATGAGEKYGQAVFVISGTVKKKHQAEVKEIADLTRAFVKKYSIYKGKAIRLRTNYDGDLDIETPPSFLDLSKVREEELVLPKATQELVEANLFTPIMKTDVCRSFSIPLKRSVGLEGPFGTGKTLIAYVTAKKCQQNGWTFIYLDRVSGLDAALNFAKQYMPAAIFAEDIDRVVSGQDRTVEIDDVLNTIDGIESKNSEIITILTSNEIEKVNKAMLRPGRLDAVIHIPPPDAEAAERLMRQYSRGLIPVNADLTEASQRLQGKIAAVIREVVERAKLFAISRTGTCTEILGEDLAAAAFGMERHLALMNQADEPKPSGTIDSAVSEVVRTALGRKNGGATVMGRLNTVHTMVDELHDKLT